MLVQFYHDLVSNLDRAVTSGHKQTDVYKLDFYGIRGSTYISRSTRGSLSALKKW